MNLNEVTTGDFDWMKTIKPWATPRDPLNLPYFDESFRLFINLKRDYRTDANSRKMIVMAAPNMTVA